MAVERPAAPEGAPVVAGGKAECPLSKTFRNFPNLSVPAEGQKAANALDVNELTPNCASAREAEKAREFSASGEGLPAIDHRLPARPAEAAAGHRLPESPTTAGVLPFRQPVVESRQPFFLKPVA